jgi:hypothetical protein
MITISDQLLSQPQVDQLKEFWNQNQDRVKTKFYGPEISKPDLRLIIHQHDDVYKLIKHVVDSMLPDQPKFYSAYERQHNPTPLHIDPTSVYTFIISLDEDPRLKTLVWKEHFKSNEHWQNFVYSWQKPEIEPDFKISTAYPISHTYDENKELYLADYLTLDGVFEYRLGTAACFLGHQVHCSGNWQDLIASKDFVVVHTQ